MEFEREIIDQLCTAAAMIMEDAVEMALMSGGIDELSARVASIETAAHDLRALAEAAAVLIRRGTDATLIPSLWG